MLIEGGRSGTNEPLSLEILALLLPLDLCAAIPPSLLVNRIRLASFVQRSAADKQPNRDDQPEHGRRLPSVGGVDVGASLCLVHGNLPRSPQNLAWQLPKETVAARMHVA